MNNLSPGYHHHQAEGEPPPQMNDLNARRGGFLGRTPSQRLTPLFAAVRRLFGLLLCSFCAAVRWASAVARAVGWGASCLPLAGLPGFVRPSGGVWLLGWLAVARAARFSARLPGVSAFGSAPGSRAIWDYRSLRSLPKCGVLYNSGKPELQAPTGVQNTHFG